MEEDAGGKREETRLEISGNDCERSGNIYRSRPQKTRIRNQILSTPILVHTNELNAVLIFIPFDVINHYFERVEKNRIGYNESINQNYNMPSRNAKKHFGKRFDKIDSVTF